MFFFIAYIAIVGVITFSQSYEEDVVLSLLILFPIWVVKTIYIHKNSGKMGNPLIRLMNTFAEEHNMRTTLIVFTLGALFIGLLTYFLSDEHWNVIPWLVLLTIGFFDRIYMGNFLEKALVEKGIYTGVYLIEWDRVLSFNFVEHRKKKDYIILKIFYRKFYSYHVTYLNVVNEQKEEVADMLEKMVSISPKL